MSVFETALVAIEQSLGKFEEPPHHPQGIVLAPPRACCSCGAPAPSLDTSFIVDPTLQGTNASSYAVFKGIPGASHFWSEVLKARCSAVVCLGHDESLVDEHLAPSAPPAGSVPLPDGRALRCVHRTVFSGEGLVVRQLEVVGPDGQGQQWVNFLHLVSWPAYGTPSTTAGMLRLCQELESCRRPGARIAVQCCCGTDAALGACPAGAFIAVDMLAQRLARLQLAPPGSPAAAPAAAAAALDVRALVRALRAQKGGLVETEAQYEFVCAALADEVRRGLAQERRLVGRAGSSNGAAASAPPPFAPPHVHSRARGAITAE